MKLTIMFVVMLTALLITKSLYAEVYQCPNSDIAYQLGACDGGVLINEDDFIKVYSEFIFNEVIVDSVLPEILINNLGQYKQAADNGAQCHNDKVNNLRLISQDLWRASFLNGRNLNSALSYYKSGMKLLGSQEAMDIARIDSKQIVTTGLCIDEIKVALTNISKDSLNSNN